MTQLPQYSVHELKENLRVSNLTDADLDKIITASGNDFDAFQVRHVLGGILNRIKSEGAARKKDEAMVRLSIALNGPVYGRSMAMGQAQVKYERAVFEVLNVFAPEILKENGWDICLD